MKDVANGKTVVMLTGGVTKEVYDEGHTAWRLNGELHNVRGPAVKGVDGYKAWYLYGKRHRVDGPAIEYPNGDKEWYLNGLFHREEGPAVEWSDGHKEWWLNNKHLTEQEHKYRTGRCWWQLLLKKVGLYD